VSHVGDSRAILCRKGSAIQLTLDHKADRPDEIERIRKAGGFVIHKRVMGELAISRAIGDRDFKESDVKLVVADPELYDTDLTDNDEFLVLACDGLSSLFICRACSCCCSFSPSSLCSILSSSSLQVCTM
jgi:protein phosphatase 2C